MDERSPSRPITVTQIMGILASTLALFFMVSFVAKSLDAYRLKNWRDHLKGEIVGMIQQRVALEEEIQRRQSQAWVEEVLRDAGQVPEGVVSVAIATATPDPAARPTVAAMPTLTMPPAPNKGLLSSPHWRAWMRLLWGFD